MVLQIELQEIAKTYRARVIHQKPQGYGIAVKAALLAATRQAVRKLVVDLGVNGVNRVAIISRL
jgi:glycosyltransferase involved in cell wall biosynthesis